MCLKEDCKYIEIVEVDEFVKILIHYDKSLKPILIQYTNAEKKEGYEFDRK
jgi:hypothetical protein